MNGDLQQHLDRTQRRLDELRGQAHEDSGTLRLALEELGSALEELEVTSEELEAQNEELRSAQHEIDEQRRAFEELFDLAPQPYVVTDPDGMIRQANGGAAALFGVRRDSLVGRPLLTFVADGERRAFRGHLLQLIAGAPTGPLEFTVVPRVAQARVVSAEISRGLDRDGAIAQLRWLLRDTTEARRAQVALQEAVVESTEEAEQLRELDRWKDAFLAAAAHDVRAPLSVITSAAETLINHPGLDQEAALRIQEQLLAHALRLDRLLSDLLDLDRFTRGTVVAERRSTDLAALVDEVVATIDLGEHPLTVAIDGIVADVDPLRVEQIVTNLVCNAVDHTPAGTPIHVTASRGERAVTLVVEDEGPGIPDEVMKDLFAPFVTARVFDGDQGGTGLGLSLVQLFAELHGGVATAEHRPGGGARFVVELPVPSEASDDG